MPNRAERKPAILKCYISVFNDLDTEVEMWCERWELHSAGKSPIKVVSENQTAEWRYEDATEPHFVQCCLMIDGSWRAICKGFYCPRDGEGTAGIKNNVRTDGIHFRTSFWLWGWKRGFLPGDDALYKAYADRPTPKPNTEGCTQESLLLMKQQGFGEHSGSKVPRRQRMLNDPEAISQTAEAVDSKLAVESPHMIKHLKILAGNFASGACSQGIRGYHLNHLDLDSFNSLSNPEPDLTAKLISSIGGVDGDHFAISISGAFALVFFMIVWFSFKRLSWIPQPVRQLQESLMKL
eukprot:gnl/MRDRNA2_/MRDRNA2_66442_c0_seq2.p1 gnl/MRDRNA2_/MRDRNA2_66442_c0~~gnl/MRDRNA2_/MRDRNA2_66442_c0_seq2.p1  ORF type:complete len:294 (+),score=55.15 gnl/MRDRNA2_/MRDRNA2_66442_c0_seq2:68-949(+)